MLKVVSGKYLGQTGRVVSVDIVDGDQLASILTDGINTEIRCSVGQLQVYDFSMHENKYISLEKLDDK
jgi:hypothetical protein